MNVELDSIHLIGIELDKPTTNQNGQSSIDCGNLWQQFEKVDLSRIPGKLGNDVYAVYHQYESDHTGHFHYFIGCRVESISEIPKGFTSLTIPKGSFFKKLAKGQIPNCIAYSWKEIWNSDLPRSYRFDFEVYGEKSKNWSDAEVEIYIS